MQESLVNFDERLVLNRLVTYITALGVAVIFLFLQNLYNESFFSDEEKPQEENHILSFQGIKYRKYSGNFIQLELIAKEGFFQDNETIILSGDVYLKKQEIKKKEEVWADHATLKTKPLGLEMLFFKEDLKFIKLIGHARLKNDNLKIIADKIDYDLVKSRATGAGDILIYSTEGWSAKGVNGFFANIAKGVVELDGLVKGSISRNENVFLD